MSFLNRTIRVLAAVIALALIAAKLLIMTNTIHDPIGTPPRPVWNGQGIYDSGTEPLCPAADAGHLSWVGPHRLIQVRCGWNVTEYDWSTTGKTR